MTFHNPTRNNKKSPTIRWYCRTCPIFDPICLRVSAERQVNEPYLAIRSISALYFQWTILGYDLVTISKDLYLSLSVCSLSALILGSKYRLFLNYASLWLLISVQLGQISLYHGLRGDGEILCISRLSISVCRHKQQQQYNLEYSNDDTHAFL